MDIHQALDQIGALLRDLAPVLWDYYENLIEQGFSEEQAMQLVASYQQVLFLQGGK